MDPSRRRSLALALCWLVATGLAGLTDAFAWRMGFDLFHTLLFGGGAPAGKDPATAQRDLARSRVVLVDVTDETSLQKGIVDRATLARIISRTKRLGAAAIGLDILFEGPRDPGSDAALRKAIEDAGCVVLAVEYTAAGQRAHTQFASAARALGVAHMMPDPGDGYLRTIQHRYEEPGGAPLHSLGINLARLLVDSNNALAPIEVVPEGLELRGALESTVVPVDAAGYSILHYIGPAGTVPSLKWTRLIDEGAAPMDLRGRAVLMGAVRTDIYDAWLSPFLRGSVHRIAGVEIHAQDLLGHLSGTRRRSASATTAWMVRGLAAAMGLTLAWYVGWIGLALAIMGLFVAIPLSMFNAFVTTGLILSPAGALVGILSGVSLCRMVLERERMAELIRSGARISQDATVQKLGLSPRVEAAIGSRYRDIQLVGSGGMGKVYSAYDPELRQKVAIKIPDQELMAEPNIRRRFFREIEALRNLSHPGIVALVTVSADGDVPYYAMELVTGISLREWIGTHGPQTVVTALRMMEPVVGALALCHSRGIIHRDVKPDNVLVARDGKVRLTDFGLAYFADQTRLTRTSVNVGTPAYMAPEQLEGDVPSTAVDVYACGLVIFELVTGDNPFRGKPSTAKLGQPTPSLAQAFPGVVPGVDQLVADCLRRSPTERLADAGHLYARLKAMLVELGDTLSDDPAQHTPTLSDVPRLTDPEKTVQKKR